MPFFQEGLAYARANMYKSDGAPAALLNGEIIIDGTMACITVAAAEGIADYLPTVPASSYTLNKTPALNIPLIVKVEQEGNVVFSCAARNMWITADDLIGSVQIDLADQFDTAKAATITVKAAVFDQVIDLAAVEIPAK